MTNTRRSFLANMGLIATSPLLLPNCSQQAATSPSSPSEQNYGLQLYTFRDDMAKDPVGTLRVIAELGIKQIETARSDKGHYYGLAPQEMKARCEELGMTLRSGHVHIDDNWLQTMDEAVLSGQDYLICSSMQSRAPTKDNFKRTAELFNKAGEECNARGLKFGYHNHTYEFESVDGTTLYDLLLDNTQAELVHMELDLGWVVAAGKNPLDYFKKYPGRFALWHLKDMNVAKQKSTELGNGALNVADMLGAQASSGVQYIFLEQEKYTHSPLESMRQNMKYLAGL